MPNLFIQNTIKDSDTYCNFLSVYAYTKGTMTSKTKSNGSDIVSESVTLAEESMQLSQSLESHVELE